ncbi:hypothetical protein [Brevibacillus sp. NL20B1]|jgi:hypothetical protein|uniref:hypothetical protein n=1 Tax=Brevibacillus sp. NL20B1 TaxID=2829799 RepID=UPI001B97DD3C|nr:hypothetical protein [Brevibacillus sp. NL20B1]MBR8660790.1 hypothetical protein [Brevibacillus sp. NL20B1]
MRPQAKPQSVVVWETGAERNGSVVSLPAHKVGEIGRTQEATVTRWTVGPEERPATVTVVSSGFGEEKAAAPQAVLMRLAA